MKKPKRRSCRSAFWAFLRFVGLGDFIIRKTWIIRSYPCSGQYFALTIQKTSREMIQGIDKQYGLELEKVAEKSTVKEESGIPVPEKADEISKQDEREEGKERPDKPYVLIQNIQLLSDNEKNQIEKGAIYTVEELEKVFEEEKE
ncbi:MAG: hypothetical protein WAX04_00185 [Oscillospiraceae bacterium]